MTAIKPATPHYTLDAGRCIVRAGVPFCTLHGVGQYSPTELDAFARQVVRDANAYPRLVAALKMHARCEHGGNAAYHLLRDLGEE